VPVFERQPDVLRRFREGDRDALEEVYRCYVDDVLRLLRAGFSTTTSDNAVVRVPAITDRAQVLDVTQEVFLRAFGPSGRSGYDGLRPYRPYLLRIARNLRIDQLRRSGREILVDPMRTGGAGLDFDALVERDEPLPAPEAAHSESLQRATTSYLERLSDEQRRFVTLRFEDSLSQVEVASRMSITRRRARTLESTVLKGLRRFLVRQQIGGRT
jgi:RNA polymerase sigma factor (sigma-70 family)